MQTEKVEQPTTRSKHSFLNTVEAAAYLGLQRCTLEAWRCRGGGPRFVKLGRSVRYTLADLNAWIDARTRANTHDQGATS